MPNSPIRQSTPSRAGEHAAPRPRGANAPPSRSILWFAATTLLGAFLVFQVQPIISKCVLPWFGGSPAVWTTCMLFFQLLLFAGYLYAHLLQTRCHPVAQAAIHLSLLAAAAVSLPIQPSPAWQPTGAESPTLFLLWMLARHVGLPYFVLSSTGPLVQAWLSYQDDSPRVYRLYALSNAGSLGALLSYPFLVEPVLSVAWQSIVWSLLFCLFVLIQGYVAVSLLGDRRPSRRAGTHTAAAPASGPRSPARAAATPPLRHQTAWLALPALASVLLLVVTNHVCQDIAVVPFLWVLPLSLYLTSFIVCFNSRSWYHPKPIAAATLVAVALIQAKAWLPGPTQLIAEAFAYMVVLLGACLLCHGEVARIKPPTASLTRYYAMLSGGGALGGVLVAVVCPLLLDRYAELPFVLALITALTFLLFFACQGWRHRGYDWSAAARLKYGAAVLMAAPLVTVLAVSQNRTIASQRNFFGVLQVREQPLGTALVHGSTVHGMQRRAPHQAQPTTYYGFQSGVGRVFAELQQRHQGLQVGVVGLGCGVLTAYGRAADHFELIEINPAVVDIARRHFTFMRDCPASMRCHLGDGRLVLERLGHARFDLLVLDAFSSDAIPAHLLTREAVQLYRQRLASGGVLAVHTSNNHLELPPLVHRLSADAGLESRLVFSRGNPSDGTLAAMWVIVAEPGHWIFDSPALRDARAPSRQELADAPLWTDQHHDLLSVLKLWGQL